MTLYYVQVYNTMIRYLCILQNDQSVGLATIHEGDFKKTLFARQ